MAAHVEHDQAFSTVDDAISNGNLTDVISNLTDVIANLTRVIGNLTDIIGNRTDAMNWHDTHGSRTSTYGEPGPFRLCPTMIGLGIMGLIQRSFTPIWTGVPKGCPRGRRWPISAPSSHLDPALGLLWRRTAVVASGVLLASLLLWMLLFRASLVFRAPFATVTWWACGETALMAAAAWVLYAGDKGLRIARVLFGLALIPFGVAHFTYLDRTIGMVPGWLPWHAAWAYFTGCALIAAGVAVLIGVCARLAATLAAVKLGLFTLLVWVPVIAAGPDASQWSEFVVSWALMAGAWVVADSYGGVPWVGLTRSRAFSDQRFASSG
jgi:uncharacterized membrane protein YphA (DoxX/SURF4 family)